MTDLKKVSQDFPCDDCSLVFSDCKKLFNHRIYHMYLLLSTVTDETLLGESHPLCLIKYPKTYNNMCLEEFWGSGRPMEASEQETNSKQVMRCKYYPECNAEFYRLTEYNKHAKEVHNDDRPFVCHQCNYAAGRYHHLKKHLNSRVCSKKYKCYLCPEEYSAKKSLDIHLIAVHKELQVFHCHLCPKSYGTNERLKCHLLTHEEDTIKCRLCSKDFPSMLTLREHIKEEHRFIRCHLCPRKFSKNERLRCHLLTHEKVHVKSHDCTYCGEKYTEVDDLKMHFKMHFPTLDTTKCHLCSRVLPSRSALRVHLKRHYNVHKCHLCAEKYSTKEGLNRHLLTHEKVEVNSYDCTYCGAKYTEADDLHMHLRIHFPTPDSTKCHLCPKEFPSKARLKVHLKSHYKMFRCQRCPKKFTLKSDLDNHLLSRHKEVKLKSHDCFYCGKKFALPYLLKKHLKAHLRTLAKRPKGNSKESCLEQYLSTLEVDVKSHDCTYCGEKYTHAEDLQMHLKIHFPTPDATKCHLCSKELRSKSELKIHLKRHYKMFKCHLCPMECALKSELNNHLLARHKEVNIESHDCRYCGKKFALPYLLKKHIKVHLSALAESRLSPREFSRESSLEHSLSHEEVALKSCLCTYCGEKYAHVDDLKMHLKVHFPTPDTTKCHICSRELDNRQRLKSHLKRHFKMFKCHLCSKEYPLRSELNSHLLSRHKEVDIGSHDCSHCGKRFILLHLLKKHEKKHLNTLLKCHLCPKEYTRESSLKRHLLTHEEADVKSHDCSYCGEKYAEVDDLKKHFNVHFPTPDTTKCHLCAKEFSTKPNLVAHIKTHYKVFKCHLCPNEYGRISSLNKHLLSHGKVDVKSHDCTYCGEKFTDLDELKMHLKIHFPTPDTTKCHLCSRELHSISKLRRHIKSHYKLLHCHICPKEYTSKLGLKKHLQSHQEGDKIGD